MNDSKWLVLSCFTLCSRVRHWDRLWSSAIKGEGEFGGWCCLVVAPCHTLPLWIADQVRNDGKGCGNDDQRGLGAHSCASGAETFGSDVLRRDSQFNGMCGNVFHKVARSAYVAHDVVVAVVIIKVLNIAQFIKTV